MFSFLRITWVIGVRSINSLDLEATRVAATTGLLELAALGADVRGNAVVGVRVAHRGGVAEEAVGLAGLERATEQHGVGASRGDKGELVESQALAAGLGDASAGTLSEVKGADLEVGRELRGADVVGDGANNNSDLAGARAHERGNLADGHRRAVGAGGEEALQDDAVELGVRAAGKEAVELWGARGGAGGERQELLLCAITRRPHSALPSR